MSEKIIDEVMGMIAEYGDRCWTNDSVTGMEEAIRAKLCEVIRSSSRDVLLNAQIEVGGIKHDGLTSYQALEKADDILISLRHNIGVE